MAVYIWLENNSCPDNKQFLLITVISNLFPHFLMCSKMKKAITI